MEKDSSTKIEPLVRGSDEQSIRAGVTRNVFTQDEYQLAKLGYKQGRWLEDGPILREREADDEQNYFEGLGSLRIGLRRSRR